MALQGAPLLPGVGQEAVQAQGPVQEPPARVQLPYLLVLLPVLATVARDRLHRLP